MSADRFRDASEQRYERILAVFAIVVYLLLLIGGFAVGRLVGSLTILIVLAAAGGLLMLAGFFARGMLMSYFPGHAVRVGPQQYPGLHGLIRQVSTQLGLDEAPVTYVAESGGVLNALATRLLRNHYVIIYSGILEACRTEAEVRFVVGHEVGHVALGHVRPRSWLFPGLLLPLLPAAWSRAKERSADRCGYEVAGDASASMRAMAVLAAGRKYGAEANLDLFARQQCDEGGFFATFRHLISTHPSMARRAAAFAEIANPGSTVRPRRNLLACVMAVLWGSPIMPGSGLIVVAVVLAALLSLPVLAVARSGAREMACMSELRQVGMALVMYMDDAHDCLPPADRASQLLVAGGYLGPQMFNCPVTGAPYAFVYPVLPGGDCLRSLTFPNPSEVVLAQDSEPHRAGGRCVLFADGHVSLIADKVPRRWICPRHRDILHDQAGTCPGCGTPLLMVIRN